MISDQFPKLIRDQFDQPLNVHGKKGPKRQRDSLISTETIGVSRWELI